MGAETGRRGRLIAFEGIDGTGKSTQVAMLARVLRQAGLDVVTTREPTEGVYGQRIRQLYQARDSVSRQDELDLFLADRREHVARLIAPGLAQGKVIVTDRYYFSTAAYQGAVQSPSRGDWDEPPLVSGEVGFDPEEIIRQNEAFAPVPDLVLLLELPPELAVMRIQQYRQERLNHFEQEEGLRQVERIFNGMDRDFIRRVDASQAIDAVHAQVVTQVRTSLILDF